MKKLIVAICMAFCVSLSMYSQAEERNEEVVTKSGRHILPQAGDIAIGVDATPFLEYAGNLFTDAYNDAPKFDNVTLYGKYFLSQDRAIRAKLRLNLGSEIHKGSVMDDLKSNSNSYATVEDKQTIKHTDIQLEVGYEFRRGYGRLQGFYGAGVAIGCENLQTDYEYGNAMTNSNRTPSTTNFVTGTTIYPSSRILEASTGTSFNIGINGFVGVEYFVAPKLSIGAEFSANLAYAFSGKGKFKQENYNSTKSSVEIIDADVYSPQIPASKIGFHTVTEGNLYILFHF